MRIIKEPSLRQNITDAYFAWFDAYASRQWDKMLPHVSEGIAMFGQAFDEICYDSEKVRSCLRSEFSRLPMPVTYKVKKSEVYELRQNVALVMVTLDMTVRNNDNKMKLPDNRISAVMLQENGGWKLGHVHFSRPGREMEPGEDISGGLPEGRLGKTGKQVAERIRKIEAQKDELEKLNITKDKLFSIIANDLKNPFHNIIGFSELLHDNLDQYDQEHIKSVLHNIHQQARETHDLLENLLYWSQTKTSGLTIRPVHFKLLPFVEKVVAHHAAAAAEKAVSFSYELPDNLEVYADKQMLQIVLRNLVHNAIKFNHKSGEVRIAASSDQFFVHIIVSDTGIGISRQIQDNLLKGFANQSLRGTSNEKGIGLGLIICKECIARHNGHLWFESEPGEGSCFTFTLPVIAPKSANELFGTAD